MLSDKDLDYLFKITDDAIEKAKNMPKKEVIILSNDKVDVEMKKFNFCVGYYWPDHGKQIGTYAYGKEVFFGDIEDAKSFKEYVESKSPERKWFIFKLVIVE